MKGSGSVRKGRSIVAGTAEGPALVIRQPLSLAGGISLETGRIIDVHAPQLGVAVTGRVLVMPVGRGSSTTSTVLAEAIRLGVGPSAIVLQEVDQILAMGAIVARKLYGQTCPILVAEPTDFQSIRTDDWISIRQGGFFSVRSRSDHPDVDLASR